MKRYVSKWSIAVFIAGALFLSLGGSEAFAIVCSVVNKPVGAGSAVVFDVTTDEVTFTNPSGEVRSAGFISIDEDGDGSGDLDVFGLPANPGLGDPFDEGLGELPDGAHNSGPGDDGCDGVGIDDLEVCFAE